MYLRNTFPHSLRFKKANPLFRMCASPTVPGGGRLGFFSSCHLEYLDNKACVPSSSDMTLIFLQVEDDVELHQMAKRSRRDDLAKAMIGGKSKSSDTGASKGKGRGKPINIPLDDISPELKKILVREMVKGGRAKVVKKSQIKGQGK